MLPVVLVLGKNLKRIESLCVKLVHLFKISNQVESVKIVHPLAFLDFTKEKIQKKIDLLTHKTQDIEEKVEKSMKNIFCFKRAKKFIYENKGKSVVIIDNFINSLRMVETLIYNLNFFKTPITHFICEKELFKTYSLVFKNVFDLDYEKTGIGNQMKTYLFSNYYQIIDKNIPDPKKVFFNVLIEWTHFDEVFKTVNIIIKKVYCDKISPSNSNSVFKKMVDIVTKRENRNQKFYLLFNHRNLCYLFNLQTFDIFTIPRYTRIYKFIGNNYLLIEEKKTKINKLDFVILKKITSSGNKSKNVSRYFENEILRII